MLLRERQRAQRRMRLRQSPRMRHQVDKQAAKLAEQEEQDALVGRREARAVATWDKCSAGCLRRRSPICKRAMR
jgi:hypothetical protein